MRTLPERFYQLYGEREDLVEVGKTASGIKVFGLVAALAEQGPKRGPQNIFVNRRIIKDKTVAHAIIEAYSVASVKERSPEVHLFIEMEPDQVDVNVHPTKAEVRFRESLRLDPSFPQARYELGVVLEKSGSVHRAAWPQVDESALVLDEVEYPVQVNGKVRDRVVVPVDAPEADIIAAALALPNVVAHTEGKTVRKVVVVPGKLVSVVVG